MRYDRQTRLLMDEISSSSEVPDAAVIPRIEQLERTALALSDDYLLGFTYYYFAYIKYYTSQEREGFTQDLSLAVEYLLRAHDHEMLARVYTLVAIDAFTYGSYDTAYNYYMHALQEAKATENIISVAVIETNLALIFMELGDDRQARRHIRIAIRSLKDVRSHPAVRQSLLAAYIDDAMISLSMKEYAAAGRALKQAKRCVAHDAAAGEDFAISRAIVALQLAIAEEDRKEERAQEKALLEALAEEAHPEGYCSDIRTLCIRLLQNGRNALAGRIIACVEQRILQNGQEHLIRMFTTLKIDYYTACGSRRKVREAVSEQIKLLQERRSVVRHIQKYTLSLARIDNEIRNTKARLTAENVHLQKKAYYDALTGIANRYMLTKLLEAAYERAHKSEAVLGIEILDLDYFKEYNDTYGHPAGDECLIAVASVIDGMSAEEMPREASVFTGRYGGDEFVIIYEGLTKEDIVRRARALGRRIRQLKIAHRGAECGTVSVSQGICISVPARKHKVWDFLSAADAALYEVKRARGTQAEKKGGLAVRALRARDAGKRDKYGEL